VQSEKIENYLAHLQACLQARAVIGDEAIVQEIRGYLVDAASGGTAKLDAALADLGTPEELSGNYHAEAQLSDALSHAGRWQLFLLVIKKVGRNAVATAPALLAIPLFVMCVAFVSLAFVKLLQPEGVPGIVGKFNLGALVRTPQAHEIFGWMLLPLGLLMAALCFSAGTYLLKAAARRMLAAHHRSWRKPHAL
jgi:hypothetical protein